MLVIARGPRLEGVLLEDKPELIRAAIVDFAATGGDILDASSVIINIAGISGRSDVDAACRMIAPAAAADPDDPVLQRAQFLLSELLRLHIWL